MVRRCWESSQLLKVVMLKFRKVMHLLGPTWLIKGRHRNWSHNYRCFMVDAGLAYT